MLKWLHGRNAVIESLPVEGKRKVILVRRDNIEHLVMVGGRNDLLIESNIMRRAAPKPGRRPTPEPPPKSIHNNLEDLTRQLEAQLRAPDRVWEEARSPAQSDAVSRPRETS